MQHLIESQLTTAESPLAMGTFFNLQERPELNLHNQPQTVSVFHSLEGGTRQNIRTSFLPSGIQFRNLSCTSPWRINSCGFTCFESLF